MKKLVLILVILIISIILMLGCSEKARPEKNISQEEIQSKIQEKIPFKKGKKLATLKEVVDATSMEIIGDELFVLDEVVVYVYSLKDFKLLRKFGRKGNGPGEFVYYPISPVMMDLYDGKLILSRFNKVAIYSKSGKLLKEKIFSQKFSEFTPISENYAMVVVQFFVPEDRTISKVLVKLFNSSFKIIKTIYEKSYKNEDEQFVEKIGYQIFRPTRIYLESYKNHLFVFDPYMGFPIKVFNEHGDQIKEISVGLNKVKMTESFKNEIMDWMKADRRFKMLDDVKIALPKFIPSLKAMLVKQDRIYFSTYFRKKGFSIFLLIESQNSKLLKKIYLPTAERNLVKLSSNRLYAIEGNKYFYLYDNHEHSTWELHLAEIY